MSWLEMATSRLLEEVKMGRRGVGAETNRMGTGGGWVEDIRLSSVNAILATVQKLVSSGGGGKGN